MNATPGDYPCPSPKLHVLSPGIGHACLLMSGLCEMCFLERLIESLGVKLHQRCRSKICDEMKLFKPWQRVFAVAERVLCYGIFSPPC